MEEMRRRIVAARVLRGLDQRELQRRLADAGLGRQELGRLERGEFTMTRVRRLALCDVLNVPEEWFTAETVDELFGLVKRSDASPPDATRGLPAPGGELGRSDPGAQPNPEDHGRSPNPGERDARQGNGG